MDYKYKMKLAMFDVRAGVEKFSVEKKDFNESVYEPLSELMRITVDDINNSGNDARIEISEFILTAAADAVSYNIRKDDDGENKKAALEATLDKLEEKIEAL